MIILGIETSCDETSAALVSKGRHVLSSVIGSQVDLHSPFGGVVPEIAARRHLECIGFIIGSTLKEGGLSLKEVDGFAAANGPGLAGALLVGLNYAKALSFASKKPLKGVNHIEGHVSANFLDGSTLEPPFICLVVSGGHTLLINVSDYTTYKVIGSTRDDAAGEAFDKVARVLGLDYPGGPEIDKLASKGSPDAISFPRAKVAGLDFSFSGLKTAVIQHMARDKNISSKLEDVAASFQQAVVDVLVNKTVAACKLEGYETVAIAGGVACNRGLRSAMEKVCNENGFKFFMPKPVYCTDNAAMIASRAFYDLNVGNADGLNLNAFPGRIMGER